ncbi:hypothetical protein [Novosphingobium sp.]|uniref:hypothetical protein n=1 Tax=Novosphingobium sp. TaxID=1874826 RepID=UPI002FDE28A1
MNLANILRTGTPAELREIGELLLQLADMPRDAGWQAMTDSTLKRFQNPDDARLVDHIQRWDATCRAWHAKLYADKTSHRHLLAAELERRGDTRTEAEYLADVVGAQGVLHSDVEEAFLVLEDGVRLRFTDH